MKAIKSLFKVLILTLAFPAIVNASLSFPEEPAGSTFISECNMSAGICGGTTGWAPPGSWFDLYGNGSYLSDGGEPVSPPWYLDSVLPYTGPCSNGGTSGISCGVGGSHIGYIDNKPNREIFVGFTFRINSDYSCSLVGASKVFFVRTFDYLYGFDSTNGVLMIRGCGPSKTVMWSHNTGNNDNSHTCSLDLGLACFPNVGPGQVVAGQWVKIGICIRSSTTHTSRDGVFRWWVNGVLAGDYTNANYGTGSSNEVFQNETWDGWGNGQGFTSTAHQQFGHMYVSSPPNGGCAGAASGGGSPTPSQWTNEPAGSQVVLDWPFTQPSGGGLVDAFANAYVVNDTSDFCSPSSALENRLPAGTGQGGSELDFQLGSYGARSLYIGACWKIGAPFWGLSNTTNKMFFAQIAESPAFWAAKGGQGAVSYEFVWNPQNFGTLDNCHIAQWEGDCPGSGWLHSNIGGSTLVVGQMVRLETFIQQSSTTTSRDGIVRWWINGVLAGNHTNVNFRGSPFTQMSLNHTWDGSIPGNQQQQDTIHRVGHMRISLPVGGGGSVDTTPPTTVGNLRFVLQ